MVLFVLILPPGVPLAGPHPLGGGEGAQACLRSPLPPEGACLRSVSALAPLARLRSGLRLRASARLRLLGCSARLRFRLSARLRLRLLGWISVGFGLILGLVRLDLASGFHLLGFGLDLIRFGLISIGFGVISVGFGWIFGLIRAPVALTAL